MNVNLISYSQPPEDILDDTPTDLVAFCARVSNPSNQNNKDTSEKLIRYLIKHAHWSPLEMVNVCLEIETTRDIARQILTQVLLLPGVLAEICGSHQGSQLPDQGGQVPGPEQQTEFS